MPSKRESERDWARWIETREIPMICDYEINFLHVYRYKTVCKITSNILLLHDKIALVDELSALMLKIVCV